MNAEQVVMALVDMAECGQGWISEDNDHPDEIPDNWRESIIAAAKAVGYAEDVELMLPTAYKRQF